MKNIRCSWNEYFMKIAHVVAERSTCDRAHVGCVLVKEKRILTTGYNGSIAGGKHCDDVGHDVEDGHCKRTIHAETNAILQAAKFGINIDNALVYVTHSPCFTCFKNMVSVGISSIYYDIAYHVDDRIEKYLKEIGGMWHRDWKCFKI